MHGSQSIQIEKYTQRSKVYDQASGLISREDLWNMMGENYVKI